MKQRESLHTAINHACVVCLQELRLPSGRGLHIWKHCWHTVRRMWVKGLLVSRRTSTRKGYVMVSIVSMSGSKIISEVGLWACLQELSWLCYMRWGDLSTVSVAILSGQNPGLYKWRKEAEQQHDWLFSASWLWAVCDQPLLLLLWSPLCPHSCTLQQWARMNPLSH